ncbi:MAG: Mrp/NBP35 family ATP-binding protein [Synergistaceae bacterium]|nr:Mrp/NBP35 family ATP-binding protein [Synergistaceae bacterium]
MANCNHDCSNCSSNCGERTAPPMISENPNVKNVIGIVSGKGGVGKSIVTSMLASSMRRANHTAAILDADITGPSIPKMFGIHGQVMSDGKFIQPAVTRNGIRLISMNLCLANEGEPVVWRGPVIAGVVKQFWEEVDWGMTDYMFVDMPPGTGDVPLTVFQSLPVKGIIIVTTPQELVSMIVHKAVKMAEMMHIPVLGLIQNMAYFECDSCGKKHYIFGNAGIKDTAESFGIKACAEIPVVPKIAEFCDKGLIDEFDSYPYLAGIIDSITHNA